MGTFTTARGRLMLRLMLLFFTPDLDTLVLDTLLQLWLLQLLLLLLLLPPLLSIMPFWEPQFCPTLSTLWPTHSWELSTPVISECALTIWENRWTAKHTCTHCVWVWGRNNWGNFVEMCNLIGK